MAQAAKANWDDDAVDEVTEAILGAAKTLNRVAEQALGDADARLTVPQLHMLTVLAGRGASSVAALATELQVNRSTALRMVDRLVASGAVSRSDNPANGREVVVKPTRQGTALIRKVASRRRRATVKLLGGAGADVDRKTVDALAAVAAVAR